LPDIIAPHPDDTAITLLALRPRPNDQLVQRPVDYLERAARVLSAPWSLASAILALAADGLPIAELGGGSRKLVTQTCRWRSASGGTGAGCERHRYTTNGERASTMTAAPEAASAKLFLEHSRKNFIRWPRPYAGRWRSLNLVDALLLLPYAKTSDRDKSRIVEWQHVPEAE
jgi:hypothetical protein